MFTYSFKVYSSTFTYIILLLAIHFVFFLLYQNCLLNHKLCIIILTFISRYLILHCNFNLSRFLLLKQGGLHFSESMCSVSVYRMFGDCVLISEVFWRNGSLLQSRPDPGSVALTWKALLPPGGAGVGLCVAGLCKVGLGFLPFPPPIPHSQPGPSSKLEVNLN